MRIMSLLAIAVALTGAPACFHPEFHDVACGADGECPDGTSCFEGTCSATTTPGCPVGQITSLSGTVHAPNGTLPLYDVRVYVPDGDPPELPEGASCTRCGAPPPNLAFARTGSDGAFTLRHVPAGDAVPIVIETGKWRRQIVVPVAACTDTALDAELTRLPRTR